MWTLGKCYEQLKLDYPDNWRNKHFGDICKFKHEFYGSGRGLRSVADRGCLVCKKLREQTKNAKEAKKKDVETNSKKRTEYEKRYYLDHQEEKKRKRKAWYQENKEQSNQTSRQYRKDHLERCLEKCKRWTKENPEKCQSYAHKRRAFKRKNKFDGGGYKASLYTKFDRSCAYCGKPLAFKDVRLDHVRALINQGDSVFRNYVSSCAGCNGSKGKKCLLLWYPQQPFFSHDRLQKIRDHCAKK